MKRRTNFIISIFCIFILFNIPNLLAQPCNVPGFLPVTDITQNTATLNWVTNTSPPTSHCWTIEVGALGFDCGEGQQVVETTVCEGDPEVEINGDNISYSVMDLQAGTSYEFSLVETCDGVGPGNSGPCQKSPFSFSTLDDPFSVLIQNIISPSCPEVSPGYGPNGSFIVLIKDGLSCPGTTYNISVVAQNGSSPEGNTPPPVTPQAINDVMAGNFLFEGAGAGQYKVTVTETGPCNPADETEIWTAIISDGTDIEEPTWMISDMLGNVLVDNDDDTEQEDYLDFGQVNVPEGSCSFQQNYFAIGLDDCDGFICNPNAVNLVSNTTDPSTVSPATQVNIERDDYCNYLIDVNWSVGTTTLVLEMCDAAGNCPDLTMVGTIIDNINPSVTLNGLGNVTIPVCAENRDIVFYVNVDDLCDQVASIDNLEVDFDGTTLMGIQTGSATFEYTITVDVSDNNGVVSASYTDDFGNVGFTDAVLTVVEAVTDSDPIIDVPGNLSYHIPVCQLDGELYMSIQIWDDCEQIVKDGLEFDADDSGIDDLLFFSYDSGNNTGYWEYSGYVEPGNYLMLATYTNPVNGQTTTIDFTIDVTQDPPQPAQIIMPGNLNFTVPVCANEVNTSFSVTIIDECDDPINEDNASFHIQCGIEDPVEILPVIQNDEYFEFSETFSQDMNGCLLIAEYTDGDGQTTLLNAMLTITDQSDNWAPLIIYPSQDISVELDPCETGPAMVFFEVTATDNCDGDLAPIVKIAPSPTDAIIIASPGGDTWLVIAEPGTPGKKFQTSFFFCPFKLG